MSRPQSSNVTRAHLDGAVATIRGDIRELTALFNKSQGKQNDHLDEIDAKVDAIMEMLAMRRELKNLVRELRAQGIAIDAAKVFVGGA